MESTNNNHKKDYLVPASILIAGVLIAGAVVYSLGLKNTGNNEDKQAQVQEALISDAAQINESDVVLGDSDAPLTIISYSDPSCPFCAAAAGKNKQVMDYLKQQDPSWEAPIPGIIENYVKTGKAKFIFRYFPGHGTGEEAMKMMFCANEQGKFWELGDKIFDNQDIIENSDELKKLAVAAGLDIAKINSCLASGKYDSKLAEDTASGKKVAFKGTPAFIINGKLVEPVGALPYSEIKIKLDQALTSR